MASFSFNWIGENWFQKPPNPVAPINFLNFGQSLHQQPKGLPNFAFISGSLFGKSQSKSRTQGKYKQMLEQYFWECEKDPDYRHSPEVEEILAREKGENLSPEEIEEHKKRWDELKQSPVTQFLLRAEEIADKINEMELEENAVPYRKEDRKLWKKLPHVIGPDGRPMPRKAIKTRKQSDDKFWDFARQFFFGLWGFRQRPYPPGRPIDVAQAIGYKQLEKRYYDFIMRSGGWYYKDRLGRTRGPLELITLKTAWAGGIIDTNTFIWGEDMDEWAPIGMVYGLQEAIATWEVRLGAATTAFIHKFQKGIPPWVPLKGHEKKTYKQLQEEAIESKRRDLAVLEANGGVWPGVRIPSHALFLWASGPELTPILEKDHMPNKFIPKDLRKKLASVIPGLRPWEILSLEQAMDQITYGGEWYREPLGTYTTGPPYIRHWNRDIKRMFRTFYNLSYRVCNKLERTMPGFLSVVQRVQSEAAERHARRNKRREEELRADIDAGLYDKRESD
ncbi:hypothetical protein H6P81_001501 [Aristolochia fimbriata]|uniref:GYF domain-containing protein n=1 Tax=Aristolochia fimbriata TaxID=158543 RepID=A0AAV7FBN0_ARIFI|nr:hypothetical protein H6P81_001501 [Aristolochia fimbriata]